MDGSVDGSDDGSANGLNDGSVDGVDDGLADAKVGEGDSTEVVGAEVGMEVGAEVGTDVGADVTSVALPCEIQEQYLATSSPPIVVVNFRMLSLH